MITISLISKLSLSGGVIILGSFFNFAPVNVHLKSNSKTKEDLKNQITKISSIDEIELYEKINSCSFVYVETWKTGVLWGAREFSKKEKSNENKWEHSIIEGANIERQKNWCKEKGGLVTLFYDTKVNRFQQEEAPGGW